MSKSFLDILKEKIIVFDGATGTHLQGQNLTPDDFGGEDLAGCNEYLVVSKPSAVENVHRDYLEAGCDVIETDTFGSTSIVLAEYALQERAYELNYKAAQIAKRMAADYSKNGHQRFVNGSMGPTTKLPSLGHISFKEMADAYREQAKGLVEGGVDVLSVETCQDILQAKAAIYGIFEYFEEARRRVPVIASVTIEAMGTMLLGTEISAALTSLEPYDIDVIGMNCATGPKEMSEHVRVLSQSSPKPIFVMPNAGLPENIGGRAHYHLSPEELVHYLSHFVKDLGVNVVGGCCGTTKEHIRQLVQAVGHLSPKPRKFEFTPSASSLYQSTPLHIIPPPILVGERTNANGSKLFRDLLAKEDWEGIVAMGREQVKEQAHMLDVCAAYVGRNESADMREIITRFNKQITIPLVIDSTEAPVIEEALQRIAGKAVVNSINLEDGEERINKVVPLCKKYGAAVIALTIDEKGMAKSAESKLAIAKRIYDLAVNKFKMKPHDIIFDTLTFTLGSGDEEFRKAGVETIEAIKLIKKELPGVHTTLGVSNISFGLSPATRNALNSVFLHYAVEAGLDMAIVHASKIMPLFKIDERARELCRQLVFDERRFEGESKARKVVYDPLTELMAFFEGKKAEPKKKSGVRGATVEEKLKNRIIDGDKVGLQSDLDEARKKHSPLDIINNVLLDGMKVVGDLFGSGQMQLPFVLQSAEVMKSAVAHLEQFMEKEEGSQKGTMVIATVKGDVHDIGKNLVDIILTNNGYKVVNLGIKCALETMLHAAHEHKADAIGMSGLLVKSTLVMKENLEVMNEQSLRIPVILGGAALTRRYVEQDLRSVYQGSVHYANDAFDGLRLMERIVKGESIEETLSETEPGDEIEALTGSEAKIALALAEQGSSSENVTVAVNVQKENARSTVNTDVSIPSRPFWGSRVVDGISIEDVFPFINDIALIRGQWRVVRGKLSEQEYQRILKEQIYPEYEELKKKVVSENLLVPQVVYGYFPCQSQGNDLVVYRPASANGENLQSRLDDRQLQEWLRFSFPRQRDGRRLCISDFFASVDSGNIDVVAFHLVTVGKKASVYSKKLFEANNYKDYLYFHGLSVECAEGLAELWHMKIREELGIAGKDGKEIRKLFSQTYQGSRYSFGYPACPNLEDQAKLFELLQPERIGVSLSEEFQLDPEQSTSAIIVHHPEARYFNVK
ncbi:MAG: methionine synthase [Ignavibacteriales bacterium]|nr:methionine synthase [Ignavibacteriales bacterium]